MLRSFVLLLSTFLVSVGFAFSSDSPNQPVAATAIPATTLPEPASSQSGSVVLGPHDQITLAAPEIQELDKRQLNISSDGTVSVPLVGRIKAAGLTTEQFEARVTQDLKKLYLDPQVSVSSVEYSSKAVSVLGSVNKPGVEQADGQKSLLEMLSLAGGLRTDAGPVINLTRPADSPTPLPAAVNPTPSGKYVTGQVSVASLLEARDPAANVKIEPGDVITVPKGKMIYVVGDVKRAGGFVIGENDSLTVLKAISLAEGLNGTADSAHARILRSTGAGQHAEEPFDVRKLLAGKTQDVPLRADDILFIPSSTTKKVASRVIEAAIATGTGIAIWHF
ncbi:MAG TPA: polysaccharide biosynthesis/export family protein [Bryobacteraceae bacterium]|jgi:polysaccharide export outer membrane protein|nr:polysaccharide biosynthesis/export family protein [Bryobacteraceae bacterium]